MGDLLHLKSFPGKTLQTISFLIYLKDIMKHNGPYLVVAPLSVLFNWVSECKRICPTLRFIRLHTNDMKEGVRMRQILQNTQNYDVCITTYEMIKCKTMKVFLSRMIWRCIVLDEGHRIKNDESGISECCSNLKARFKLILSGTPVQNNLREIYSLLNFLHPNIFDNSEKFEKCFKLNPSDYKVDRTALNAAHHMLRPFVLRRIKAEVEVSLPPKTETLIRCPMSSMQKFWIKRLLLKDSNLIESIENQYQNSTNNRMNAQQYKQLQSLLAQLRKAANHPYLFPGAETPNPDDPESPTAEIIEASGKMKVLDKLLPMLQERGHRVVLFSQYTRTLDILSDYLNWKGYLFYRLDGRTNRVMRAVLIEKFNKPGCDTFLFCLSTRAGGEGVNLYTADTAILFDSDWNPQVDIQAMARVHRIGQTKPVHVYRLVSVGSVEERIIQRAQKKLFLDGMINRGSTANALRLDDQLSSLKDDDQGSEEQIDSSTLLSTLKFGWNACFDPTSGNQEPEVTVKDLEVIIDRTIRTTDAASTIDDPSINNDNDVISNENTENCKGKLKVNQESSVADFDESVPFISLRTLDGETILRDRSKDLYLSDISTAWLVEGKRKSQTRFEEVKVGQVGMVNVLKINNYSLEEGEPSVFEREGKAYVRTTVEKRVRKANTLLFSSANISFFGYLVTHDYYRARFSKTRIAAKYVGTTGICYAALTARLVFIWNVSVLRRYPQTCGFAHITRAALPASDHSMLSSLFSAVMSVLRLFAKTVSRLRHLSS